jgi:predicted XRE-type DNA-binding protein
MVGAPLADVQREEEGYVSDGRHGVGQSDQLMESEDLEISIPDNARLLIRSLIDQYDLSRDQVAALYDEYEKIKFISEQLPEQDMEEDKDDKRLHVVEEPILARVATESPTNNSSQINITDQELQGEVNRLQSVVQSAMETYGSSSSNNCTNRRAMVLPEDPLPSSFARELLQRDQTLVAQAIRKYLHQYSIPQREVVEKTGINQSHLSQHFTRGVPIKPAKRIKLYHWFEHDQLQRTGKLLTADGSITSVLESPKVEGYRRRPRWRWSPVATQILTEAFKKNRFPTREQRAELSRICNEAESAMNNGEPVQGPSGDTEGITEQRINTWFTNRRKGLVTPSPTTDTFHSLSGLTILSSPNPSGSMDSTGGEINLGVSNGSTSSQSQLVTSSLALPINLSTPSTTPSTSNETISLSTPLAVSSISLQALVNQLQSNANTPLMGQNIGQILVGQIPQGLLLQSPHSTINIESIKQSVMEGDTSGNMDGSQTGDINSSSIGVAGEEIIQSHHISQQPSSINNNS